jgi:PAS domain S-box-containing protein
MNIYIYIIEILVCLVLGFLVFYKNPKNKANILYLFVCLAIIYWDFTDLNVLIAKSYEAAILWSKLDFAALLLSIAFVFHFVLEFLQRKKILKNKLTYVLIYVPVILYSIFDIFTSELSGKIIKGDEGWILSWTGSRWFLLVPVALWIIIISIYQLYLFYMHSKKEIDPIWKKQVVIIGIGILISTISTVIEGVQRYLGMSVFPLLLVGQTLGIILTGYAILRYETFILNPVNAAKSILSTMSDSLFLTSSDKLLIGINKATLNILGYKEEEILNKEVKIFFEDKKIEKYNRRVQLIDELFENDVIKELGTYIIAKSGKKVPVSLSSSLVRNEKREVLGVVCICRDMTSRKEAERKTKSHEKKLSVLNKTMIRRELEMIKIKKLLKTQ